jgi:GPH family glycoside/pentoside/hexuronide:cation symporter
MGISPSLISLVTVLYRFWDALTDVAAGWVSDNTRTRWGRRRPYVFVGAIATGIWMPVIWFFPRGWPTALLITWMVGMWMVRDVFASAWNVPYQALMLEMSSCPKQRTSISAMRSYFGSLGAIVVGWVWYLTQLPVFEDASGKVDIILGARWVTAAFAIVVVILGILPAIFAKERFYTQASKQARVSLRDNFRFTFTSRPFWFLVGFTFLFVLGTSAKGGLSFYTELFYVCGGDQKLCAQINGLEASLTLGLGLAGIPLFQWLAGKFGQKPVLMLAMGIVSTASLSTLVTYTPSMPYLMMVTGLLQAPAMSGLWLLLPPMLGDIVDYDELRTSERREGAFMSIFSWVFKLGYTLAAAVSGPVVELAGFRIKNGVGQADGVVETMRLLLAVIPASMVGLGLLLLAFYPLGRRRMNEVRAELEARRGVI